VTPRRVTVDVGNSSVGVGVWEHGRVSVRREPDPLAAAALVASHGEADVALISVAPARLNALLGALDPGLAARARVLDSRPEDLAEPALLSSGGADRIANALAVRPGPAIVVDAGTAVTVDVIDGAGRFRGGWIAAGPEAAARGLAQQAAQLPTAVGQPVELRPGVETASALSAGLWGQAVGGVDKLVDLARAALRPERNIRLVATGGWGALWAADSVHTGIECDASLVHRGIARWAGWR
jgi:type III pantothenate kinase